MKVASCYWNKMICFKSQFSLSIPFFRENHSYMQRNRKKQFY